MELHVLASVPATYVSVVCFLAEDHMEFLDGTDIPKRGRKREENAVEKSTEFKKLLAALPTLDPSRTIGLAFDPTDAAALGLRWPARVAVDSLRRHLKSTDRAGSYSVQKFRQGDKWFVTVKSTKVARKATTEEAARKRDRQTIDQTAKSA
jgi:hypothetical protein